MQHEPGLAARPRARSRFRLEGTAHSAQLHHLLILHASHLAWHLTRHTCALAGFFNWDFAGPATPAWDLALAAFSWASLHGPAQPPLCPAGCRLTTGPASGTL